MSSLDKLINNKWSDFTLDKRKTEPTTPYSKDEFVNSVLNILSKPKNKPKETSFAEEIRFVSKITEVVAKNISDGTISESQGEILLKYLLSGIISKRVSKVFENIGTESSSYNWILAAGQKKFETKTSKKANRFTDFEFIDE